jgi:hypothetical protein
MQMGNLFAARRLRWEFNGVRCELLFILKRYVSRGRLINVVPLGSLSLRAKARIFLGSGRHG